MTDGSFLCSLLEYRTYCIEPPYITWSSCQKVTDHAHYGQVF